MIDHAKFLLFRYFFLIPLFIFQFSASNKAQVTTPSGEGGSQVISLENEYVACRIAICENRLSGDTAVIFSQAPDGELTGKTVFFTDADFRLDMVWTGWKAPGKISNADNQVSFSKEDFVISGHSEEITEHGTKLARLFLKGENNPFIITITYELIPGKHYFKRKISVADTVYQVHFLQKVFPAHTPVHGLTEIIKTGGFGQPAAGLTNSEGAFFGIEYPTAENCLDRSADNKINLKCKAFVGTVITGDPYESDYVVYGISPERAVKKWFMRYVDDIRISPLRPYTLYNSWYDLRSTEYPGVPPEHHMNEANILRIIDLINKNMIEKNGIELDAFVLDDGWDIYESDWILRKKEFPNGLKPIADKLAETNTGLGIWFGPTAGYSFRKKRIDWMRKHGYETVGDEDKRYHAEMLCLAGKKYSDLFRKRTVDFVVNDNVSYFKWDGIQFTCSEPDHGHPVGIYSRNAVMESVIDKCNAVREANPDVYLNITSGTWLSPWWVKYANQIWMDAYDYGLASVPSYSKRDAAITYRDLSLYTNFFTKDLWFPIANLMTHGIIKGKLQKLGGEDEPIDKFTDNALLYFARGVSMWELYISPDILNEDEWDAIAGSISWAKDRFDILANTEMIGGDPASQQCYGYVHFKDKKGIIALRNPSVIPQVMSFKLSGEHGLKKGTASLVLEQVYPFRQISPDLYAEGAEIEVSLEGFETRIFEVYPLELSKEPLLAGLNFEIADQMGKTRKINVYGASDNVRILNPEKISSVKLNGESIKITDLSVIKTDTENIASDIEADLEVRRHKGLITLSFSLEDNMVNNTLGFLFHPGEKENKELNITAFHINGVEKSPVIRNQKGQWAWVTTVLGNGHHEVEMEIEDIDNWHGHVDIWLFGQQKIPGRKVSIEFDENIPERVMPPLPLPSGIFKKNLRLGHIEIN